MTVLLLCGPCSPGPDGVRNCGTCRGCDCLDDAHGPDELAARMRRLTPSVDVGAAEVAAAMRSGTLAPGEVPAELRWAGYSPGEVAGVMEALGLPLPAEVARQEP